MRVGLRQQEPRRNHQGAIRHERWAARPVVRKRTEGKTAWSQARSARCATKPSLAQSALFVENASRRRSCDRNGRDLRSDPGDDLDSRLVHLL
jgi:hypothetical protein